MKNDKVQPISKSDKIGADGAEKEKEQTGGLSSILRSQFPFFLLFHNFVLVISWCNFFSLTQQTTHFWAWFVMTKNPFNQISNTLNSVLILRKMIFS